MALTMNASLEHARPSPFTFSPKTTALVLIDFQQKYKISAGFGRGHSDISMSLLGIIPLVEQVVRNAEAAGVHVVYTLGWNDSPRGAAGKDQNGINGRQGLEEVSQHAYNVIPELTPSPGASIIDKNGSGSFWVTRLHRILLARGVTHVFLAGITAEGGVLTTLRECSDRGYKCCILSDCTVSFDNQAKANSLELAYAYDELFGHIANSNDLIDQLDQVSQSLKTQNVDLDAAFPSIAEQQHIFRVGTMNPVDFVNYTFDRIERYEPIDPAVWISRKCRDDVIAAAKSLIAKYSGKPRPPLYGVPFAVKDSIDVEGIVTTVACESYSYLAKYTAVSVQHVLDAGAIYIGKVNLDQLATGLSGCRSPYGITHSFYSNDYISGGSSSGSAVAVAAGLVSFAVSTDTAGSTRVPAALNGIVGFKPTKGTISARGLVPACKSLDTITIIAPTVEDARTVWYQVDQHDPLDPYAKSPRSLAVWDVGSPGPRLGMFTFGIPPASLLERCVPQFQSLFHEAVRKLESCGGRLVEVDYSPLVKACDLLYDATLVHERLASMGHEFFVKNIDTLHPTIKEIFGAALNSGASAWEVFRDQEAQITYTSQAQKIFTPTDPMVERIDVLFLPSVPFHPTIKDMLNNPIKLNSKLGLFTHAGNVVDLCGVSVNGGWWENENGEDMPFGVTFLGGSGYDGKLLDIAGVFEDSIKAGKGK